MTPAPGDCRQPLPSTDPLRQTLLFWLALALCLASRLPFLDAGYGNDPDAWELIRAARHLDLTGEYVASRLPGYPLPEFACALLWRGGPIVVNLCTALFSVAAAAGFMLSLKRLAVPHHLLAGLAFALTPVVYINSTTAMDYVWALAFIMAAFHLTLLDRPVASGLLLGAAVACRLTSALMLLPLGLVVALGGERSSRVRRLTTFVLATIAVAGAAFQPVVSKYGMGFLSFYSPPAYPDLVTVLSRATLHVWGLVGLLGIAGGVLAAVVGRLRHPAPPRRSLGADRAPIIAALAAVILYAAAYLRLPLETGYLLPAVPFVLLLLGKLLPRRPFRWACAGLCLAAFFCHLGRAGAAPPSARSSWAVSFAVAGQAFTLDLTRGPVLHDHFERWHGLNFVDRVVRAAEALPPSSVVVVGYWLPQIQVRFGESPPATARFLYLLGPAELERMRAEGTPVYYLPEMADFNREARGLDLARAGAAPLRLYWRQ